MSFLRMMKGEFLSEKYLWCCALIFVNSKIWMSMRESRMVKTADMIREATLSSTVVKKLLWHRREWLTIKFKSSARNHLQGTVGWQKSEARLKIQISHPSSSLCKLRQSKKVLAKQETIKLSARPSTWLRSLYLWLFCSELWIVWVTNIFLIEFALIVQITLKWKKPYDLV